MVNTCTQRAAGMQTNPPVLYDLNWSIKRVKLKTKSLFNQKLHGATHGIPVFKLKNTNAQNATKQNVYSSKRKNHIGIKRGSFLRRGEVKDIHPSIGNG